MRTHKWVGHARWVACRIWAAVARLTSARRRISEVAADLVVAEAIRATELTKARPSAGLFVGLRE